MQDLAACHFQKVSASPFVTASIPKAMLGSARAAHTHIHHSSNAT